MGIAGCILGSSDVGCVTPWWFARETKDRRFWTPEKIKNLRYTKIGNSVSKLMNMPKLASSQIRAPSSNCKINSIDSLSYHGTLYLLSYAMVSRFSWHCNLIKLSNQPKHLIFHRSALLFRLILRAQNCEDLRCMYLSLPWVIIFYFLYFLSYVKLNVGYNGDNSKWKHS